MRCEILVARSNFDIHIKLNYRSITMDIIIDRLTDCICDNILLRNCYPLVEMWKTSTTNTNMLVFQLNFLVICIINHALNQVFVFPKKEETFLIEFEK